MRFLAAAGVDFPFVSLLRQHFTVIYAGEEMKGATDDEILKTAFKEDCVLITKDKDFGEMVVRNNQQSKGIILLRIEKLNNQENCITAVDFIKQYASEFTNSFTVIQEDKIRIRKL